VGQHPGSCCRLPNPVSHCGRVERGHGWGDIKLFFVIGLVLGTTNTLVTLFLAALIGSIAGMIILKRTGQGRKTPVAFGPSIALAAVIAYFWGADFVGWYSNLFF
jgi:leader peptidase (prepilin peptidase) / N-methyltransferase